MSVCIYIYLYIYLFTVMLNDLIFHLYKWLPSCMKYKITDILNF